MSEPVDSPRRPTGGTDAGIDNELVRRESWPVDGVAELELSVDVGRMEVHLDRADEPEVRVEVRHDPGAGGMWARASAVCSLAGRPADGGPGPSPLTRRGGRAGRRDQLVGARAAADRALVAGPAAAGGPARGHRDRTRGLPPRRPHRTGRRRSSPAARAGPRCAPARARWTWPPSTATPT